MSTLVAIVLMLTLDLVFVAILLAIHVPLATFRPAAYAVVRRNFLGYFTNPSGYVFLMVFVLLTSAATFLPPSFFNDNLANLEQLNTFIPLIMLVFIPTITMSIWAEERRQGTDELLLTLPATDFDVVIGKYLAAVNIFTASLLFSKLSVTTVLAALARGDLDFGLLYANYFGYWLIGLAMIAIGMSASFLTSNLTVGFILGVLFNAPLAFLSWVGQLLPAGAVQRFFYSLSFGGLFDDFRRGIFSLSSLTGFLTIIVGGIFLCMILIGRRHWPSDYRGALAALHSVLRLAAAMVIGISGTALLTRYDYRYDVTGEQISSPSPESMALVRQIGLNFADPQREPQHPIIIDAYISEQLPEEFVRTRYDLISLLKELDARGGDALRVNLHQDISVFGPEAVTAEKRFGIRPVAFSTTEQGQVRSREVILGAAIRCGLDKIIIPLFEFGIPVEYELIRSINTVSQAERRRIGVVRTDAMLMGGFTMAGGQPRQLPKSRLVQELEKQYLVDDVNPEQPIDASAYDLMMVVQPSSLSPQGMENLVAAIKTGIPTAIFEDPFPQPSFWPGVPGTGDPKSAGGMMGMFGGPPQPKGDFRKLIDTLELSMVGDFEFDALQPKVVWQQYNPYQQFPLPAEFVFLVSPPANSDIDPFHQATDPTGRRIGFGPEAGGLPAITAGIDQVLFPWPGAVSVRSQPTLPHQPLASTFTTSGEMTVEQLRQIARAGSPSALDVLHQQTRTDKTYDLAIAVGDFSQPLPPRADRAPTPPAEGETPADGTPPTPTPVTGPIRAVFVSDIDLLSDLFFQIRSEPQPGIEFRIENVTFVLNMLDVLAGDTDYALIRSRKLRHKPLVVMEEVVTEANDAYLNTVAQYQQALTAEQSAAQEEFNRAVDKFLDESEKLREKKRRGEAVDPQQESLLNQRMALTREAAQRRLTVKEENLEKQFESERRAAQQTREQRISETQNTYKLLAVALPVLPPLIVGIGVFFYRRFQELEGISTTRLR